PPLCCSLPLCCSCSAILHPASYLFCQRGYYDQSETMDQAKSEPKGVAGLLSRLTESSLCDWRGANAITLITCRYRGQVQPFKQHSAPLPLLSPPDLWRQLDISPV
ncbi:hypothetical protein KUCAC02_023350, partial [Chaenocephalus aceratus]